VSSVDVGSAGASSAGAGPEGASPRGANSVGAGPVRVPDDAWALLADWLPGDDDPDRPQITLSTVDADGGPDARTVLLSSFDRDGFVFHTDAASRKVAQLEARPQAAITVLWPGFTRQIVVRGVASRADAPAIARAYRARSPYLQQLAWLNSHDFAGLPLEERRARWAAFEREHAHGFEQPAGWTGFVVRPTRLTFWTSAPDTASRRREWSLGPDGWTHSYRAG